MTGQDANQLFRLLTAGRIWTEDESRGFFAQVVGGGVDPHVLAGALSVLKSRGETTAELAGAAQALLASATAFSRPTGQFADVVGTGGDGHNTINLSTIAALTAAACGCPVVKHGNRSITSNSGSFDLLQALNIPFEFDAAECRRQFDRCGICFLFAPRYHAGMRHAGPVRNALGVRTIFNLLGPLVNPARPPAILLGVADPGLQDAMASALQLLGCEQALVVHGSGVDEVAIHGPTRVIHIEAKRRTEYQVSPQDFGCPAGELNELVCSSAAESHRRSAQVLAGKGSDSEMAAACVNTAMVMRLFGRSDLRENFERARHALRDGLVVALVRKLSAETA